MANALQESAAMTSFPASSPRQRRNSNTGVQNTSHSATYANKVKISLLNAKESNRSTNASSSVKEKQSFAFDLPKREAAVLLPILERNFTLDDILMAIAKTANIPHDQFRYASAVNGMYRIYFKHKSFAEQAVLHGFDLNSAHYSIRPLIGNDVRIILSNVDPEIPHSHIRAMLQRYGHIQGPIRNLKAATHSPEFAHILGFRRQVFMSFDTEADLQNLPKRLQTSIDGLSYTIYVQADQACELCGAFGHLRSGCSQRVDSIVSIPQTGPLIRKDLETASKCQEDSLSNANTLPTSDIEAHNMEISDTRLILKGANAKTYISEDGLSASNQEITIPSKQTSVDIAPPVKISVPPTLRIDSANEILPDTSKAIPLPSVQIEALSSNISNPHMVTDSLQLPIKVSDKAEVQSACEVRPVLAHPKSPDFESELAAKRLKTTIPESPTLSTNSTEWADLMDDSSVLVSEGETFTHTDCQQLENKQVSPTLTVNSYEGRFTPYINGPLDSTQLAKFLNSVKGSPRPLKAANSFTSDIPGLVTQLSAIGKKLKKMKSRSADASRISKLAKRISDDHADFL